MSSACAIQPALALRAGAARRTPRPANEGSTVTTMATTAAKDDAALAVEEESLARAAASGDGEAFATLYDRYEQRAYNLAYRILGGEHDAADATQEAFLSVMRRLPKLRGRELAFGSYLFTATRNACYDLVEQRKRSRPSGSIAESATPLGSGAGGMGLDPGDPEQDPERSRQLAAQQEEIRAANMQLPERQREALALRELEELSYDEIAAVMEMNRNSVAQLISRARINLRDELRGTALASVVASSPECERALPLIAMRDDAQLVAGGEDAAWLAAHLGGCERCRVGVEAMQEAGASYRAWAPIAAAPWLYGETMARAAELAGTDWSGVERPSARRRGSRRRRFGALAAGAAALLLGGGLAAGLGGNDPAPAPAEPAAETTETAKARASVGPGRPVGGEAGEGGQTSGEKAPTASSPSPPSAPAPASDGEPRSDDRQAGAKPKSPTRPPGRAGVDPPKATAEPPSETEPAPPPATEPPPAEPPAPPETEPPPEEKPPEEPPTAPPTTGPPYIP